MRNYFIYGGVDARDFNVWVGGSNAFNSPERDIERIAIPGRSGELTISKNRFKNFQAEVSLFIPSDINVNLSGLKAHLLSSAGYRRYEESFYPNEYRMARYTGPFEVIRSNKNNDVATVRLYFDCMPQRFLKEGDATIQIKSNSIILNRTMYSSKPLLRIYGRGYIVINGRTIRIIAAPSAGYTDIDCETMDATCGTENRNNYVEFSESEVVLSPGDNPIILSGVTVDVTPKWWTV